MLAWLYWNPPRNAFVIPYLEHPIAWYGICFVLGFVLGYFIMITVFKRYLQQHTFLAPSSEISTVSAMSYFLADRMCWFVVAGTVIGARLGAVFFYDWSYYSAHPEEILKIWKGGLASHGGAIGILLSLYLFWRYVRRWLPELGLISLLDMIAIPIPLAAFFIRLGNFMNQEILGTPTELPWAVIFENPADNTFPIPRHPVQLYEGFCYLVTFVLLYSLWKKRGQSLRKGTLFGLMLTAIFLSRFILEFWKTQQFSSLGEYSLQMGQLLSLPFILGGLLILVFRNKFEDKSLHLL